MEASHNKRRVHAFAKAIGETGSTDVSDLATEYYHEDVEWYGPEPVNELEGREAVVEAFWGPFFEAFPDLERDDYLLLSGTFDGNEWVATAGTFTGTFEQDWLGIPATGHATWIQYGVLHRLVDGRIAETRLLFDVLDVLRQAGYRVVPALAPEVIAPGPSTQDGLLLATRDESASTQTLELVEGMIFDGLSAYDGEDLDSMRMEEYWHEDFMWYGPASIGTTRGIDGFQEFHQGPWLEAFPHRGTSENPLRVAEGDYCAWTAWPSPETTHLGDGWLGLPGTGETVTYRVIDFWRREGDLLAENWVYIDMVDLLKQIGVDVFERLREHPTSVRR